MFAKKKKASVELSAGKRKVRLFCILQLCIAFTVLCWHAGFPFLGEVYTVKRELALYEFIMNDKNSGYFKDLPESTKSGIEKGYFLWKGRLDRSFPEKMKGAFMHIIYQIPPLELVWLLLSIILPVFILLEREGSNKVIWLLPALALTFAFENIYWDHPPVPDADEKLFPTESTLIEKYADGILPEGMDAQWKTLQDAWKNYLSMKWGRNDVERGEFNFTIARIQARQGVPSSGDTLESESPFWLMAYVFWNGVFAWVVMRSDHTKENLSLINGNPCKIAQQSG